METEGGRRGTYADDIPARGGFDGRMFCAQTWLDLVSKACMSGKRMSEVVSTRIA